MRYWNDTHNQTVESPVNNSYLAAENPWLQQQFPAPLELGDRPVVIGRRPAAGEGLPPRQPDLELDDTAPFRLSRNHFTIDPTQWDHAALSAVIAYRGAPKHAAQQSRSHRRPYRAPSS